MADPDRLGLDAAENHVRNDEHGSREEDQDDGHQRDGDQTLLKAHIQQTKRSYLDVLASRMCSAKRWPSGWAKRKRSTGSTPANSELTHCVSAAS